MYIDIPNGSKIFQILLRDVLYSLNMGVTLVSIGKITDSGSTVFFYGNSCQIFDKSHTLLAEVPKQNGLYHMFTPHSDSRGFAGRVTEL